MLRVWNFDAAGLNPVTQTNTDTVVDTISYGIFVSVRLILIKKVADMLGGLYNHALKKPLFKGNLLQKKLLRPNSRI